MTPEYTKKLIELAEELEEEITVLFFTKENVSLVTKANRLIGFIQALKETK